MGCPGFEDLYGSSKVPKCIPQTNKQMMQRSADYSAFEYQTKNVSDVFTCPICMEHMDDDKKSPRVMCRNLHSICHECSATMTANGDTSVCVVCKDPSINNHFVKVPVVTKLVETTSYLHDRCTNLDTAMTAAVAFASGIRVLQGDPFMIVNLLEDKESLLGQTQTDAKLIAELRAEIRERDIQDTRLHQQLASMDRVFLDGHETRKRRFSHQLAPPPPPPTPPPQAVTNHHHHQRSMDSHAGGAMPPHSMNPVERTPPAVRRSGTYTVVSDDDDDFQSHWGRPGPPPAPFLRRARRYAASNGRRRVIDTGSSGDDAVPLTD